VTANGPIDELKGPAGRVYELRIKGDTPQFVATLRSQGYECHDTDDDIMRVFVPGTADEGARILFTLASREGAQIRHLRPSVPTLEDVFARAVGER
jgi:hypothetical protein